MKSAFPLRSVSLLLAATAGFTPGRAAESVPEAAFPLRISASRRFLEDRNGRPFFYQADTAWTLFLKLTEDEAQDYLQARRQQGFNTVQVMLTGFLGMRGTDGKLPFAGTPPEQKLAEPDEDFFRKVDRIIERAEKMGMVLAIAPAWSGCCGEGWAGKEKDGTPKPLNRNGVERSMAFGEWLGKRYAARKNVIWILGGDMDPHNAGDEIRALGMGLKSTAPSQLITYHASSTHSSTDVWPADESWLDVSMVYTYFRGFNKAWNKDQPEVYEVSRMEWAKRPVRPFFLGESTYEGEHGDWGDARRARKQAWWCALSGGCGHAYGSPDWNFPANWREVIKQPGAESLKHLRTFMESRRWWELVPDAKNQILPPPSPSVSTGDMPVCAAAADGSQAVIYLPKQQTITLNLSAFPGPEIPWVWFNPRDGSRPLSGKKKPGEPGGFTPPGEGDWVLELGARP